MSKRAVIGGIVALLILSWSMMASAYTAEVSCFFEGLRLDIGEKAQDSTVLVMIFGQPDAIEQVFQPTEKPLADFAATSMVDLFFEYQPTLNHAIMLTAEHLMQIAVVDTSFDFTNIDNVLLSEFEKGQQLALKSNDLLVIKMTDGDVWKLNLEYLPDLNVRVKAETLNTNHATVPEPTTLIFFGIGGIMIVALTRLKKRGKKAIKLIVMLVVAFSCSNIALIVSAQEVTDTAVTIKKEGAGTVVAGAQQCAADCQEMQVTYTQNAAMILKAIPDAGSRFVGWRKADGSLSTGKAYVQPGETVTAVFMSKSWVPFDPSKPAESMSPPMISVPVSNQQELIIDITIPGMNVADTKQDETTYQYLSVPDSGLTTEIGKPQLPAFGRYVAIPNGAEATVEVLESSFNMIDGYTVYPAQEPLPNQTNFPTPPFSIDSAFYARDQWYPSQPVAMDEPVVIRGTTVVMLQVLPVQYNPVRKVLQTYSHLRIKVSFTGGNDNFIDARLNNSTFNQMFGGLLLNASTALSSETPMPNAATDAKNALLIITHPNFEEAANLLATWKIQKGIPTEVRTTTQTGSTAAAITSYIQNAYKTWSLSPTYVLLIGDAEFIPTHYVTAHPYTELPQQGRIGTDLYYAAIDGADYFPDVMIGRLSVDTLTQAKQRVQNIINYEKNPVANTAFYQNAAVAAYFQDDNQDGEETTGMYFMDTAERARNSLALNGYTVQRIYTTNNTVTPTYYYSLNKSGKQAIPTDLRRPTFQWNGDASQITNAINQGRFLVLHRDHGYQKGWGDPAYDTTNVQSLNNGNKLPIVWSINCETGWFDNETDDAITGTSSSAIHFSEAWERNLNGGAVGVLGATRISYSPLNDYLVWGWMDAIWPNFDATKGTSTALWEMGAVLNYGKTYLAQYWGSDDTRKATFEFFQWFGDPTMEIWTAAPQPLTVSHVTQLNAGDTSLAVTVNQSGAVICITRMGSNGLPEIVGKALSNKGTIVVTFLKPVAAGDQLYVTVTKHNYRPYVGNVMVATTPNYTVTATANTGGNVSPSGTVTVTCGTPQTVTITPNACYRIANMTVDGIARGAISNYTFDGQCNAGNNAHTLNAQFALNTYTITATAGAGGTIQPGGVTTVNCGASQTYTITPVSGYQIADVKVDGVSKGALTTYTFPNVNATHTIQATFAQVVSNYTVTATAGTGGSVSPAGSKSVTCGTPQIVTISPAACYRIANVTVDGIARSTISSYTFDGQCIAGSNAHTLNAQFALNTYTITATSGTGGAIQPNGAMTVNCGASQTYTITPASGYQIADVKVDGVSKGALTTYTFPNVNATHTIQATFAQVVSNYTVTATAGTGGSVSPAGSKSVTCGTPQIVTISPAACYRIANVTVDGIARSTISSYTFDGQCIAGSNAHTLNAQFALNTYTITATSGTGGAIQPNGAMTVNCGASQTYTITPASGYQIADVTVDGVSKGALAIYTFSNVTAPHTIAAQFTFTPIPCSYSISPISRSHGAGQETGVVNVVTSNECLWNLTSNASWITVPTGITVGGNGSMSYTVTANPTSSSRTGTISIGGQTFTVTQAGIQQSVAPTGVIATDGTFSDKVRISWNAVSLSGSFYSIYRNTVNDPQTATLLHTGNNLFYGTSFDDTTASPGQTYYYWVKAMNLVHMLGGISEPDTGFAAFAGPTGVNASDGTYTDRVRITWNPVNWANAYAVFRNTTNDVNSATSITSWLSKVTSFDDMNATAGQTYYYWVKAADLLNFGGIVFPSRTSAFSLSDSGYKKVATALYINIYGQSNKVYLRPTDGTGDSGSRSLYSQNQTQTFYLDVNTQATVYFYGQLNNLYIANALKNQVSYSNIGQLNTVSFF